MKLIPLLLIVVGGVMIMAGIQGDNPLAVVKSVLTNTPVSKDGSTPKTVGPTPVDPNTPIPKPGG